MMNRFEPPRPLISSLRVHRVPVQQVETRIPVYFYKLNSLYISLLPVQNIIIVA